ncbi:MAG: thiamine-phosphate kinase [Bacteroidota bacterium]|nr:thiamine-phosphate kinase [Bacteroidota bacterium]
MKIKKIEEIGEFGLINRIDSKFNSNRKSTIIGIGDDSAIIDNSKSLTLITSDMLIEGVHFDLSFFPLKHLGYKSVVVNLSDIYSMNGCPNQIILNIGLSSKFSLKAIDEFYDGIKIACDEYFVDLVGGDTTSSITGMVISCTAIGTVLKKNISLRSGAKEHDVLCVSGDLGRSFLGLKILQREKRVFLNNPEMQPKLNIYKNIIEKQLRPVARVDIINILKEYKIIPSSMIDISDGLASEILHLSEASNLGAKIFEEKLPILEETKLVAKEFDLNFSNCALNGGEEYELLFSITPNEYELIKKNNIDIKPIGYFTKDKSKKIVLSNGKENELKSFGWKHFNQLF